MTMSLILLGIRKGYKFDKWVWSELTQLVKIQIKTNYYSYYYQKKKKKKTFVFLDRLNDYKSNFVNDGSRNFVKWVIKKLKLKNF